ncbi:unnamed protein product, partial [Oikopleura dioica]
EELEHVRKPGKAEKTPVLDKKAEEKILLKKSESEVTDQPRRSDTSNSRRSFPKPDLLPVNSSAGPSSESGPDAPVILNPQSGLRKLIEKVESEDNEIEEMDTSQLIERSTKKEEPVAADSLSEAFENRDASTSTSRCKPEKWSQTFAKVTKAILQDCNTFDRILRIRKPS